MSIPPNSDTKLGLVIGSKTIMGSFREFGTMTSGNERRALFPWGNEYYKVSNAEPYKLNLEWSSVHCISTPITMAMVEDDLYSSQLVTDILLLDVNSDNFLDIVTCSYPVATRIGTQAEIAWTKGLEKIYLYNQGTGFSETPNWITSGDYGDLSTSIAAGDFNPQSENIEERIDEEYNLSYRPNNDSRHMFYLKYAPVLEINSVKIWWRFQGQQDEWTTTLAYNPTEADYCYDLNSGWISVNIDFDDFGTLPPEPPIEIIGYKVSYIYSKAPDLVIGNDGKNVVYFNHNNPPQAPDLPALTIDDITPILPHSFTGTWPPLQGNATDTENFIGLSISASSDADIAYYENSLPEIDRWCNGTDYNEDLKGHYFWGETDKKVKTCFDLSKTMVLCRGDMSPGWTMGDFFTTYPVPEYWDYDYFARAASQLIEARNLRNLVNRYRPGGVYITICLETTTWGVTEFQMENEPDGPDWGYGWGDDYTDARDDIGWQMYYNYQVMCEIEADDGRDDDLVLISPNFYSFPDDINPLPGQAVSNWDYFDYLFNLFPGLPNNMKPLKNCMEVICHQEPFLIDENPFEWGFGYTTAYNPEYGWTPFVGDHGTEFVTLETGTNGGIVADHYFISHDAQINRVTDGRIRWSSCWSYRYPGGNDINTWEWMRNIEAELLEGCKYFETVDFTYATTPHDIIVRDYIFDDIRPACDRYLHMVRISEGNFPTEEYLAGPPPLNYYEFSLINTSFSDPTPHVKIYSLNDFTWEKEVCGTAPNYFLKFYEGELDTNIIYIDENPDYENENCYQQAHLHPNWNMVSVNVVHPLTNQDLEVPIVWPSEPWGLWTETLGRENVDFILDLNGDEFHSEDPDPDLTNWDLTKGYKVNMQAVDSLEVLGPVLVDSDQEIQVISILQTLDNRHHFWISYLPWWRDNVSIFYDWFETDLRYVADDEGRYYIPGVKNSIGYMIPGKGYDLAFNSAVLTTFQYDDSPGQESLPYNPFEKDGSEISSVLTTEHYNYIKYTGNTYAIVIDTLEIPAGEPEDGDEIAVFCGDNLCVGAWEFDGELPMILTAWRDDTCTAEIDGYIEGQTMSFRYWDASEETEYEIDAGYTIQSNIGDDMDFPRHSGFGQGFYAMRALRFDNIAEIPTIPAEYALKSNYPNPFNAVTTIAYDLPFNSQVKLEIFNIAGQRAAILLDGSRSAGYHKLEWKGDSSAGIALASGIYFLRMEAVPLSGGNKFTDTRKIVLIK